MKAKYENNNDVNEEKLWEYIDGTLGMSEKGAIEKLINNNAEWRMKYQELLQVQQLIQSTELEQPSLRFTKNVMDEIAKFSIAPATREYINKKVIFGIGGFFVTVIASFIIYGIFQIDWSLATDSKTSFGFDLGNVDYSRIFNNTFVNIFMMLNVVLGLMLFDRYLSSKRKHYLKSSLK